MAAFDIRISDSTAQFLPVKYEIVISPEQAGQFEPCSYRVHLTLLDQMNGK
jgi:hypothetical protein